MLVVGTLRCGMYPAGKVAISQHPGFPQCDHTVGKLSADAGSLCSEVMHKMAEVIQLIWYILTLIILLALQRKQMECVKTSQNFNLLLGPRWQITH